MDVIAFEQEMPLVSWPACSLRVEKIDDVLTGQHQENPYTVAENVVAGELNRTFHPCEMNTNVILLNVVMPYIKLRASKTKSFVVIGKYRIRHRG